MKKLEEKCNAALVDLANTLQQRGNRYGTIESNAHFIQEMMRLTLEFDKNNQLSDVHLECLHMIYHKIGRMVNGDCWYSDNAHDIGGYAKLLEDYINDRSTSN